MKSNRMKITQADIAKKLNLSVTTVSRALQSDPNINDDTRDDVQALATKLNYQGRTASKSKNAQLHRTIAVLVRNPDPRDAWAPDMVAGGYLAGMSQVAPALNISLMIHHVNYGDEKSILNAETQPPMMREDDVDGIVLIHHFEDNIVKKLAEKWPVISLVHDIPDGVRGDLISMDHCGSIQRVVEHLYNKGHRQFGFCGFRPKLSWSRSRLGAFMQSLHEKGLTIKQEHILETVDTEHVIKAREEGISAWVCSVDRTAYKLMRELTDCGISIPGDLAVTGFDAVPPLLNCPQVTTVKPPLNDMGSAVLHMLIKRLEDPSVPPIKSYYPCEIIEGVSS
jgi:LacI family transcriptional regulator